jgi:PKD repeat protein
MKQVAGAQTILASTAMGSDANISSTVARCRANGSTITYDYDAVNKLSVTDTSITGNLKGGTQVYPETAGDVTLIEIGAWSLDDGLAPAPVAAFTGTPLSGTAPLSVAFDSSATTNTPTSHLWEKNDGSGWVNFAGTPTVANPTESFTAGTWSVRYTATNAGGSDGETKLAYVVVTAAGGGKSLAGSHSLDTWRGLGL